MYEEAQRFFFQKQWIKIHHISEAKNVKDNYTKIKLCEFQ